MMKKIFLLLSLIIINSLSAQKNNIWHFGNGAGLLFSSNPPVSLGGGQTVAPDNSSTISDNNGNLLFYTNGVNVWNKNHVIMNNGSGLIGHVSAGQCALIVPIPCDENKYVIFHVTEYSTPGNLSYSIVDMSLNGGLGGVVPTQKNIFLGSGWTEKLCAYYNAQGNFYWVFSHKWQSKDFVGFKVSNNSIATQSVVTSIGSIHNCGSYGGMHDAMGQLTISPDGKKLVNALTCQDKFEVFDLDPLTGLLSNSLSINGSGGKAWGTAFSPDSKILYTSEYYSSTLRQYNLAAGSPSAVAASQYSVYTLPSGVFGYIEMGKDSSIYLARPNANYISVIKNPNSIGAACNFTLNGASITGATSSYGLSRQAYNIPQTTTTINISISGWNETTVLCAGQSVTLNANGANSYSWNPGGTGSTLVITPTISTTYSLTGSNGSCIGNSQITVNVSECTGLNEYSNSTLRVFPNPSRDFIMIESETPATLKVISLLGEVIIEMKLNKNSKIDISFLERGIYSYTLISGNERRNGKLIKE